MNTDPTIRDQTYSLFLMEAQELLQTIEQDLLSLMEDSGAAKVHNLMRMTHTLKGAAASVGLETIKTVAHSLEDVFKSLYNPAVVIDPELESLLFQGYECLRLPLTAEFTGTTVNEPEILNRAATVFAQLQGKLGNFFDQEAQIPSSADLGFDITQSIFETGVHKRLEDLAAELVNPDPEKIATMLQEQASVFVGLAESLGLPGFGAIARTTLAALEAHPDQAVTIAQTALADFKQGQAAVLAGDRTSGGEPSATLQARAIAPTPEPTPTQLNAAEEPSILSLDQLFGDFDLETSESADAVISSASTPQPKQTAAPAQTVRVDLEKLQHLSYLSGELLTNQNRQVAVEQQLQELVQKLQQQLQQHQQTLRQMSDWSDQTLIRPGQFSSGFSSAEIKPERFNVLMQKVLEETTQLEEITEAIALFTQQSSQIEKQQRLLTNVRDDLMKARMLPIGDIFNRFPRMLQQLATVHDKPAQMQLIGTDVLVDKAIAEKLYDPILHLVRNAFDHGIESRELRRQRVKPEIGQISLHAYQQERWTMIAISDDGNGLDFKKICDRAISMNLLTPEQSNNLPLAKLWDLLFEPGFSTASQLSDLSGRGIGLDVVRTQLEALQGSITIQSEPQQGTTFLLQIPLTLNIAKVLVCQAKTQIYTLFADAIEQIVLPQADKIKDWQGQRVFHWRQGSIEHLVPLRKLSHLINYTNGLPEQLSPSGDLEAQTSPVLLLSQGKELIGLEVDQVLGEQEVVIRSLSTIITPPTYVQGCCILADGRLSLMIDTTDILEQQTPPAPQTAITQILVVDDSITLRQNLSLVLQKAGYQPIQAQDGTEAIAELKQHPNIKLIICDVEMPGMNGFEFLSHRSQSPALAQIPIIILTSRSGEKYRKIALELGANSYLTKPYLDHELLTTITTLI